MSREPFGALRSVMAHFFIFHTLSFELNFFQPEFPFNLDDEFCRPVLPHNQILCLHHFNMRFLYFQFLQSLPNWSELHTSGTSAIRTPFQLKNKNTYSGLLLGQFQLKLFYHGKGRQNFTSNVTFYPCDHSRQHHLVSLRLRKSS